MTPRQERIVTASALVVVLIASGALYLWNRWEDARQEKQLFVPKVEKITPEIVLLQQYIRVDTSNPPGKELAGARWLGARLAQFNIPFEIVESAPGRGNLYARIKGKRDGEGLMLLHHIDVVPADPRGWARPPFEAQTRLNMLVGRGVLDMKSIGICQLEAFIDIARSGRQPERDIVLLATADEEAGSTWGVLWLLQHRPQWFAGVRYALNEGGVTETQQEQITYFGIEVGSKPVVTLQLRAGSREQLQRARLALEPYFSPRDADRILPEVRRYFRGIAPHRVEKGPLLADIDKTVAEGRLWFLPRGYRELLQNVVWAEAVRQQESGGYAMRTRLFNLPDENPDARIAWLRSQVAPFGVTVDLEAKEGPIPLSSDQTPMFAVLRREIHREYGQVPVGVQILTGSTNDSRHLRPRGIMCYGMWPFPVDWFQTQGIHGVDERLRLDWFQQGVELTRSVVRAWAFEADPGR